MRISAAVAHFGEEPPFTGKGGSGCVFFTGCTLQCPFCQNHQISRGGTGRQVGALEFADICISLQKEGVLNINLITGTHFIPSIIEGLNVARERGLCLPVLWNSSGFESGAGLELIDPYVDVYLPDLKTTSGPLAEELFSCAAYPKAAVAAIQFMVDHKTLSIREEAIEKGTVVRHLILPGRVESTRQVLAFFTEHWRDDALLSVMAQYTPIRAGVNLPERKLSQEEYDEVLDILSDLEIDEGFIQEFDDDGSWLPDFTKVKSFPAAESWTVWHWSDPVSGSFSSGR